MTVYCDEHGVDSILSHSCSNCGCGYHYCDASGCNNKREYAEPDEGCRDRLCGCHVWTVDTLTSS